MQSSSACWNAPFLQMALMPSSPPRRWPPTVHSPSTHCRGKCTLVSSNQRGTAGRTAVCINTQHARMKNIMRAHHLPGKVTSRVARSGRSGRDHSSDSAQTCARSEIEQQCSGGVNELLHGNSHADWTAAAAQSEVVQHVQNMVTHHTGPRAGIQALWAGVPALAGAAGQRCFARKAASAACSRAHPAFLPESQQGAKLCVCQS